ncbi:DUF4832 domain-containing protein [Thermostilla marina]
MLTRITLFFTIAVGWFVPPGTLVSAEIDLRPLWDASLPLANPHKGWYHHFYDNHVNKYLVERDEELLDFPGMDHIYLRLAWAYLEPEEGRYNWRILDEQIDKWTAHGLGVALRITCKETGTDRIEQQFATPRWVREAGAKGVFCARRGSEHIVVEPSPGEPDPKLPWEPFFDDPVFLEKLDHFLEALAAHYDGKPWLRYVDIGSVGDWGEGHTSSGSGRKYGYDVLTKHLDLYRKHFRHTQLIVSDDFVYSVADPNDRERLHKYVIDAGIGYRDDSILVDWYVRTYSDTYSVRSPEFFADAWRHTPTVLELQHYGSIKKNGNWEGRPGSSIARFGGGRTGADYFRGAIDIMHATYIGYHGYARDWLADHPELTGELLNRCGYWYFPHKVVTPDVMTAGRTCSLQVWWQNRGVAPAYHAYDLVWRLRGPNTYTQRMASGNRRWLPGPEDRPYRETYSLEIPDNLSPGKYALQWKLRSSEAARDVALPLKATSRDEEGFYTLGTVTIEAP